MNKHGFPVLATLFLLLVLGLLLASCAGAGKGSSPEAKGAALVQERCTKCHDLGRVKRARKTEEGWRTTVKRMVGKGAQLNQAEQEAVIQYLTETYGP